ncbi:sigma-54-dependent Fis family transcriptional regulator [Pseudonocardia xishanensis]|uniref:sigma-54-dependent Fis family transcriptional regulator n=1 Tax=Pseudonocardia xishanensis TaxID=630995 RepID=UPI0031ED421A
MRPEIASSWQRVRESGLAPQALVDPDDAAPVDPGSRLRRAADPVLAELAGALEGSPFTLVLADHEARLVDLRFGTAAARPVFERLGVVLGRTFTEAETGTNSIATAFETRRPISVRGAEHYLESFRDFACHGLPIVDPATRRAAGVLDITCLEEDSSPLLGPYLLRGVRDIETRLLGDTRRAHRVLLDAFDAAAAAEAGALVALGPDLVLTNDAAADVLQPADHAALQTLAGELVRATESTWRCVVDLQSGGPVGLEATRVDGGVLMRLSPAWRRAPVPRGRLAAAPAEWQAWPPEELERYRTQGTSVLVRGESGTGRRTVARAIAGPARTGAGRAEPDREEQPGPATVEIDGPTADRDTIATLPAAATTIVVTDADMLADPVAVALERLARERRLVLTVSECALTGRVAALAARCPVHLDLPTLRARRDRIPGVAAGLLHRRSGGALRFTPGALRALAALDWPGNLAELTAVVEHVVERRQVGDVTEADLPTGHRERRAPLSGALPQAECDAVVDALRTCSGNKVHAAKMLGISRTTLYRYIRQFRIDA